uniref:Uncharacterized protein n=1 Tax=Arundo donax TaxID=35708 RepID=A0A0A9HNP1_ARUDO
MNWRYIVHALYSDRLTTLVKHFCSVKRKLSNSQHT